MEKKIRLRDLPKLGRACIYSEFFFGLCVGAWSIALNFHLSACGLEESQIGVLLSVGYLVTAVTSFYIGRVGDRRGYPFVMALGAISMGAALLLVSSVRGLFLLCLGHGLYCAGLACVMSMEYNLPLSLVQEEQRQYSYNMVLVFYFQGSIAGNFMCGICLPVCGGIQNPYRYVLLLCGLIYLALALFRGRMPRKTAAAETVQDEKSVWSLLGRRSIQSYLLYGFLTYGLLTLATGMLNLVLRQRYSMSDGTVSMVFAINSVVGCLTLALVPSLLRRVPSLHRVSSVTMILQLAALAVMAAASGPLFVAMMLLRTSTCNILYPGVDSPMLQSVPSQERGTYSGMRIFSNYVGMSAASLVSGWFVGSGKFGLLYLACAGVALAQILTYQGLCRPWLRAKEPNSERSQ